MLQKKAIRIIFKLPYNAHTEPSFKSSKILPFQKLIIFFNLQTMHSFVINLLPSQFNNLWLTNRQKREIDNQDQDQDQDRDIHLRNDSQFYIKFTRLSSTQRQPIIIFPKAWNEFTNEEIKNTRTKPQFN